MSGYETMVLQRDNYHTQDDDYLQNFMWMIFEQIINIMLKTSVQKKIIYWVRCWYPNHILAKMSCYMLPLNVKQSYHRFDPLKWSIPISSLLLAWTLQDIWGTVLPSVEFCYSSTRTNISGWAFYILEQLPSFNLNKQLNHKSYPFPCQRINLWEVADDRHIAHKFGQQNSIDWGMTALLKTAMFNWVPHENRDLFSNCIANFEQ